MTPATREAALDLVAEIVDRGLRRCEQRSQKRQGANSDDPRRKGERGGHRAGLD
jgi:hypothetical protein